MGPRAGFDNGIAGGCTPLRGVDVVDVKIKLRADPSPPPDARPNGPISRGAWHSVCLSPARAPLTRDNVAVLVLEFASGSLLSFMGY